MIPLTRPLIGKREVKAVRRVLESGWLTQGPRVAEFEKIVADYLGSKFAVAFSSCTTAIHSALLVLGIGMGDEVIVPSFSFIATANSILYTGAQPVFVDIEKDTFNINPEVYKKFSNICKSNGISMSKQVEVFIKAQLEEKPKVRKEYLEKLERIRKGNFIKIGSFEDFEKRYA